MQLYKQNPLDKFFMCTIYQNYTLAFKGNSSLLQAKFWSCVNLNISNRMITKNFSGSEKVRNWFLAPQLTNY